MNIKDWLEGLFLVLRQFLTTENPFQMMKIASYSMLKYLFVKKKNISRTKGNQTMSSGQLIKNSVGNIFL